MTRLVTWNCNMAFRNKKDQLLEYDPDVLVIQECENPSKTGNWSGFTDWQWIGENEDQGLGVFTRNGIDIDGATEIEVSRHVLAIETDVIDLLAVWAMNDEINPSQRYIGQVHTTITNHPELLDGETSVVGDFNWNAIWDESPKSPLCGDFSDTVSLLSEHGLQSAYHHATEEAFGEENSSTFYMHKKETRPYHIDYAFLPETAVESAAVTVGEYDDWMGASDHMPLLLDV